MKPVPASRFRRRAAHAVDAGKRFVSHITGLVSHVSPTPTREDGAQLDGTARLLDPHRTPLEEGGMKQSDANNFLIPGLAASPRTDQG
jgi:hypothetical protein